MFKASLFPSILLSPFFLSLSFPSSSLHSMKELKADGLPVVLWKSLYPSHTLSHSLFPPPSPPHSLTLCLRGGCSVLISVSLWWQTCLRNVTIINTKYL